MLSNTHEFETIPAYEVLAGCSLGTWSNRETCASMIINVERATQSDTATMWKDLARANDDDSMCVMDDIIRDCIDLLNDHAPLPVSCSIDWRDNEITVFPFLDDEIPKFAEVPDCLIEYRDSFGSAGFDDVIYQVSDHGNVECYQWRADRLAYESVWSMV